MTEDIQCMLYTSIGMVVPLWYALQSRIWWFLSVCFLFGSYYLVFLVVDFHDESFWFVACCTHSRCLFTGMMPAVASVDSMIERSVKVRQLENRHCKPVKSTRYPTNTALQIFFAVPKVHLNSFEFKKLQISFLVQQMRYPCYFSLSAMDVTGKFAIRCVSLTLFSSTCSRIRLIFLVWLSKKILLNFYIFARIRFLLSVALSVCYQNRYLSISIGLNQCNNQF